MLKPIVQPLCGGALNACRRLQAQLLAWLCDPNTQAASLTQANLPAPTLIERDWLWAFLQKADDRRPLLERAQVLVAMSAAEKAALLAWGQTVTALAAQFQPNPPAWPVQEPNIAPDAWRAFKELMEAFYEKGLQAGLPYTADGTPVTQGGVTYADFVQAFRDAHRLNHDPNAREVCVLCGGPLGAAPEVDHWIAKHAFPLLSVCADNLLPICGECNATSNKGRRPVHDHGSFQDWFHPYFRPGAGAIRLGYRLQDFAVTCAAVNPADAARVRNLDGLLNLSRRWTRELKAEYANQQGKLKRYEAQRLSRGQARHTQAEVEAFAASFRDGLLESEPNHEMHRLLGDALLEQARLAAWQTELGLLT